MVAALTSLEDMQGVLGIPPGDNTQNVLLQNLIDRASQAITTYCKRADFGLLLYTRMLSGNNFSSITVPDVPIQEVTLTANTTQGSTTLSGLTVAYAQELLFVNQSVFGPGIAQGTVITDVSGASSGNVTLSLAATANTTNGTYLFGIALQVDNNGFAGTSPLAFTPATPVGQGGTLLQEGIDYYLDLDNGPGGPCTSGLIYRLGFYWFKPDVWIWGLVTPQTGPPIKNIKVQYLAGYSTIPLDVQAACEQMVSRMRSTRKWGSGVNAMSQADMSVTLGGPGKIETGLFTPEIRSLLAPYIVSHTVNPA